MWQQPNQGSSRGPGDPALPTTRRPGFASPQAAVMATGLRVQITRAHQADGRSRRRTCKCPTAGRCPGNEWDGAVHTTCLSPRSAGTELAPEKTRPPAREGREAQRRGPAPGPGGHAASRHALGPRWGSPGFGPDSGASICGASPPAAPRPRPWGGESRPAGPPAYLGPLAGLGDAPGTARGPRLPWRRARLRPTARPSHARRGAAVSLLYFVGGNAPFP